MKHISVLVSNGKYKDIKIYKVFKSRRNHVAKIFFHGEIMVIKLFRRKESFKREYNFLINAVNRISIPKIYDKDGSHLTLFLEFIDGCNLCDFINDRSNSLEDKEEAIELLGKWFSVLHGEFNRIHGDAILRNFILNKNIFGVDFEDIQYGLKSRDISSICASILTSDPMFTSEKIKLSRLFIEDYLSNVSWDLQDIYVEIDRRLREFAFRRKSNNVLFHKMGELIREHGLKEVILKDEKS